MLIAEETAGEMLIYHYSSGGDIIGMSYRNSSYAEGVFDTYVFEKNILGDIVAVYDINGVKLVSYKYDAWGNFTASYYSGGRNSTAYNNPFRYRGYYYDTDLALYYLNSRYYYSKTGRFINADCALYHSVLGYNMYVYCYNNPVNYVDYTGESAIAVILGSIWGVAIAEPTPVGEIVAGVITAGVAIGVGVAIGYGAIEISDFIDGVSQDNKKDEMTGTVPQQSVGTEELLQSFNKAKSDKSKGGKKVAPRIKSNSKKAAREKAFYKGGKTQPIHHPYGKYGPHFHPNNPKFSHWHYYYIVIFPINFQEQEQ